MNNVLLFVPPKLKRAIQASAAGANLPMRELYSSAIKNFVLKANIARKAGSFYELTFLATYKHARAARMQMWLDDEISADVARFAKRAAVTRRSFCYTALLDSYPIGDN